VRRIRAGTQRARRSVPARLRRGAIWIGILLLVAVGAVAALNIRHVGSGRALFARASTDLLQTTATLGLRVADIRVEGRATTDRDTILEALNARPGTPLLAVDPARAKQQLESLPWVRSAVIERRFPDTIYVRLVEREPMALWQHHGKLKLPLVVGEDAPAHANELLTMLAREPDLAAHVTAAIRVGGRRWNLRLDNAIDVLLPADDPAAAWAGLAGLQRNSAILQRDVQAIDMRLPDRLVVRVAPEPSKDTQPTKKGRLPAKNT
jgi:cell division protein FtsQ